MSSSNHIYVEVKGLFRVIPLKPFRKTAGVTFDIVPSNILPHIDAIDRVTHQGGAASPGQVDGIKRPWYMHAFQEDCLLVVSGLREVDLYTPEHGRVEHFEVSEEGVTRNGDVVCKGPAMLSWPCHVFHRVKSDEKLGSSALNFAVHYDGFDIKTNFSVYDLNTETGESRVIREGRLDQF